MNALRSYREISSALPDGFWIEFQSLSSRDIESTQSNQDFKSPGNGEADAAIESGKFNLVSIQAIGIQCRGAVLERSKVKVTWSTALEVRLRELINLSNGWDGPKSIPVSIPNAKFARKLLDQLFVDEVPAPSIFPIGDGTLQIEWNVGDYEIELDVIAPDRIVAERSYLGSGKEDCALVGNDFSKLKSWIEDLRKSLTNNTSGK